MLPHPERPLTTRYKHIDQSPRFLPVDLAAQLLPGMFVHAEQQRGPIGA